MTDKKITRVADVMTRDLITLPATATVSDAVQLMQKHHTSSIIVERRDAADEFGMVVVSDIANQVLGKDLSPSRVNVYEIMSKPVLTLAADMNIVYAVRMLARFRLSRALVVDQDRELLGIVTLRDMVLHRLEEDGGVP